MLKMAMWVHGTSARVEAPERLTATEIRGDGVTFHGQPRTHNLFHFAVPTPVVIDGRQQRLSKFFVMYWTQPGVFINAVQLWDGVNPVQAFHGPGLPVMPTGAMGPDEQAAWHHETTTAKAFVKEGHDTRYKRHDLNTFDLAKPVPVQWGLGISVGVEFEDPPDPCIDFASVGADFVVD